MNDGNIPVLMAEGESLAAAWENSLLLLNEKGTHVKTEYDRPEDPPSLDATMITVVKNPLAEPRIHRCFPGGLEDLEEYRMEVLDGVKDHWIRDKNDPTDTRWEYTYHERLTAYSCADDSGDRKTINQLDYIVDKLSEAPHSRRAQAITWKVWDDLHIDDPACLQSIWCRMLPSGENSWTLNMNVRFRSNDAYDASFMNMFALTLLHIGFAEQIAQKSGKTVAAGRYVHIADSYHIYGSKLGEFTTRFLEQVKKRSFEERTWTSDMALPIFEEARPRIFDKIKAVDKEQQNRMK